MSSDASDKRNKPGPDVCAHLYDEDGNPLEFSLVGGQLLLTVMDQQQSDLLEQILDELQEIKTLLSGIAAE